ncbi:hypothetical protein F7725_018976 [Dissostichus mawsoni]|uniref:Uncharacterized protein n=1 Tax=Dissostichus mawsoni TaxID=36200 RepID=A0A7J5XUV1_DISMA|nr:hypothetical protein F7725_018976 [Dissostichus mawsoni]
MRLGSLTEFDETSKLTMYFTRYFGPEVVTHITYQTNLYGTQKDINTTFTTNENE